MSYNGNRVYLGHLSNEARERDVEKFFKGFGHIEDIILKDGYAFIIFEDSRDADDAIYELNGKDLCGKRVLLEFSRSGARDFDRNRGGRGRGYGGGFGDRGSSNGFRGRGGKRPNWLDKYGAPIRTGHRVIVENLSSRVSWQDLKDYIRPVAEVTYADAHKIRKNEGTVEFATREDMKKAIEKLDNTEINGRALRFIEDSYDKKTSRRSESRSRSRNDSKHIKSQSRSRSRSSSRRGKSSSKSQSKSKSRSKSRT